MLNSNAADQFVLSCQHCSISSVKLLWISVKLWECEDQEMIVSTAPSTAGAFNFWSKQQWLLCFTISDGFVLFCFAWLFLILFYIIYLFIYFPLGITVFGDLFVFPNKTVRHHNNLILQHPRNNTSLFTAYQTVDSEMKRKKPSIDYNLSEFRVLNLLLPEFSQLVIYF